MTQPASRHAAAIAFLAAASLAACYTKPHTASPAIAGHFRTCTDKDRISSADPSSPFFEGKDSAQPDMDFTAVYAANDADYLYVMVETPEPLTAGKERWMSIMFDAIPDPDPAHDSVSGVNYRPTSQPWSTTGKKKWRHGYDIDFCIFHNGPKTEAFFLRYKDGSGQDWKGEGKTWHNAWTPEEGKDFQLDLNGHTRWEIRIPRKEFASADPKAGIGILVTCEGDAPTFIHEDFWPNDASDEKTSFRYSFR